MSIPTSGPLSIDYLHSIAGGIGGTQVSLNDSDMRQLAGIPFGQISFSDFYGKGSSGVRFEPDHFVLTQTSPDRAVGNITLTPDGLIQYSDERLGIREGSWIENPPEDPSIYSVVATLTSKIPPSEGIFDEHLALNRNWSWGHTITRDFFSCQFNLSIYGADKKTALATTNVDIFLEVEGGDGIIIRR